MFRFILPIAVLFALGQGCSDQQSWCPSYAMIGGCMTAPVKSACPLSCSTCNRMCKDALKKEECVLLRKMGKCLSNHEELFTNCKATCGFCRCEDADTTNCPGWAAQGGCITQASTRAKCPFSCKYCGECADNSPACAAYALQGRCTENFALTNCPASCGICECSDTVGMEADCAARAARGECESNIVHMYTYCALTCDLCPTNLVCSEESFINKRSTDSNSRPSNIEVEIEMSKTLIC